MKSFSFGYYIGITMEFLYNLQLLVMLNRQWQFLSLSPVFGVLILNEMQA